jgi:hypothetical protein
VDADAHRVYVSHGAEADVLNAGDSPHWCHNGGSQRCHRVVVIKTALVPLRRLQSDMGRGGASLLLEPNESGPENMQAGMSFRSTVSLVPAGMLARAASIFRNSQRILTFDWSSISDESSSPTHLLK